MKFFKNIKTEQAAKELYRKLAQKFHPDKGGSVNKFQEIKQEYEDLLVFLKVSRQIRKAGISKEKIEIKKEYAETLSDQIAGVTATAVKTGIDMLLNKFFIMK